MIKVILAAFPGLAVAQAAAVDASALEEKWSLPAWIPFIGGWSPDGADSSSGDPYKCHGGSVRVPPVDASVERIRWCCDNRGVWCPMEAAPATTSDTPFECSSLDDVGSQDEEAMDPADLALKRLWCCQYKSVGCPKDVSYTTTPAQFNCHVDVNDWQRKWSKRKKRWCCSHGALGCDDDAEAERTTTTTKRLKTTTTKKWKEQTTVAQTTVEHTTVQQTTTEAVDCDVQCAVKDFGAPCLTWVKMGVLGQFVNDADSCGSATKDVVAKCPACSSCNLQAYCAKDEEARGEGANTSAPEEPTSTGEDVRPAASQNSTIPRSSEASSGEYDCHGAGPSEDKSKWSEDRKAWCCKHHLVACFGCNVPCTVEGQTATCAERVNWTIFHSSAGEEDACPMAHDQVSEDCPTCSGCELSEVCSDDRSSIPLAVADAADTTEEPARRPQGHSGQGAPSTIDTQSEADLQRGASSATSTTDAVPAPAEEEPESTTAVPAPITTVLATTEQVTTTLAPTSTRTTTLAATTARPTPAPPPAVLEPYECEVPDASSPDSGSPAIVRLWSPKRRAWCCEHHKTGCPKEEKEPFDCTDGVLDWEHKWPYQKVQWCCSHYEVGCTDSFDLAPEAKFQIGGSQAIAQSRQSGFYRATAASLAGIVACGAALYAAFRTCSLSRVFGRQGGLGVMAAEVCAGAAELFAPRAESQSLLEGAPEQPQV